MRWPALLLPAAWLVNPALAVFADDAYVSDYHVPLLGLPQTSFFHQPYANSKASLLYTISDKALLGAVNPKDGAIVWRHALSASYNGSNALLAAGEGKDVVVSAVDGQVASWAAGDGRLVWSKSLGAGVTAQDLEVLQMQDAKPEESGKDVLLLYNKEGSVVQRLDGDNGKVKWEYHDKRSALESL